jgi:hypothetical protein
MKYLSLREWWDLNLPLIDLRDTETQSTHQLLSTQARVIVCLPFSTLLSGERSCELPPRHVSFGILLEDIQNESQALCRQERLQELFFATSSKATQQSRKPWNIPVALIANDELWEQSKELGIYKFMDDLQGASSTFAPHPRLWQPDPMISNLLWPVLEQYLPLLKEECVIWDLGSGAGRDVCFLAEKIKGTGLSNCSILGIDNHKASAKRCEPFWQHRQIEELAQAKNLNLNKLELVEEELKGSSVVCTYAVRFLNRKLLAFLANHSNLKPGSLFAMSHFCKPYAGSAWNFDHPKVRRSCSLQRGEKS